MKRFLKQDLPLLATGLGAGLLNGLLGAGGGILIVFVLGLLLRPSSTDRRRIYTTALAVMLPLSLLSLLRYHAGGHLSGTELLSLLPPALLGGVLGSLLLRRLAPVALARIFAIVVLLSGVLMVV